MAKLTLRTDCHSSSDNTRYRDHKVGLAKLLVVEHNSHGGAYSPDFVTGSDFPVQFYSPSCMLGFSPNNTGL